MLTDLDAELFPDDCEVVEILPHNLLIYLIQKNGSSSLRKDAEKNNWRIVRNHEIRDLHYVDVYLRDPKERYLTGINTFLQHLARDYPSLDTSTCEILAKRYLFLNRHYLPQWHWLVNLARFIDPVCKLRLRSLNELNIVTETKSRAGIESLPFDKIDFFLTKVDKLEFWFLLDKILIGHIGQELSWTDILKIYRNHPQRPLDTVMSKIHAIHHVLS